MHDHAAELEARVAVRTEELERANQELRFFTYAVTHDLRAPLRALDGVGRILNEEYADCLDDEGRRLLKIIRDSADDMDRLIRDLLLLSRATAAEMVRVDIDMTALAEEAYRTAAPMEVRSRFVFEPAPLPKISGDIALMKQVWANLLESAVKFTADRAVRRISVGGTEEPGGAVYFVRDSGIGFDMRYIDTIFEVFRRLVRSDEYPGNGVGLALVQRVVARHRGEIWAESSPGHGSTFYFSVPKE